MTLSPKWRAIVSRAWSFRLMFLAGVMSACEVVLPMYQDAIPRNLFAALSILVITGAMVARVIAQKGIDE